MIDGRLALPAIVKENLLPRLEWLEERQTDGRTYSREEGHTGGWSDRGTGGWMVGQRDRRVDGGSWQKSGNGSFNKDGLLSDWKRNRIVNETGPSSVMTRKLVSQPVRLSVYVSTAHCPCLRLSICPTACLSVFMSGHLPL